MAKAGMRRPDPSDPHGTESNKKHKRKKNDVPPVPEIQGKAKAGHEKANPILYDWLQSLPYTIWQYLYQILPFEKSIERLSALQTSQG